MMILGLTGSIGMGKSTAAAAFRRARIPVFDADAVVHRLQARGGRAVRAIATAFPGTVRDEAVDRAALRQAVLGKLDALTRLEGILHPMVRQEERCCTAGHACRSARYSSAPGDRRRSAGRSDHRCIGAARCADAPDPCAAADERRRHQGGDRAPDAGRGKAPPRRRDSPHRLVTTRFAEDPEQVDRGARREPRSPVRHEIAWPRTLSLVTASSR